MGVRSSTSAWNPAAGGRSNVGVVTRLGGERFRPGSDSLRIGMGVQRFDRVRIGWCPLA
jgi:hypothetical protein